MKKLLLALLLAVSITPIASVSADTRGGEIAPDGSTGSGGGGIAPEPQPEPQPNPDQGQGGETTPPQKPEKPQPEQPEQKPDVVDVQYAITLPKDKNRVVTVSQATSLDLATEVFGAKGEKITWINDVEQQPHEPATLEVSKVDTSALLKPQTITFTVKGQPASVISETASLVVVPDTYKVSADFGTALSVDPSIKFTQAEAKALSATTLAAKLNAKGIDKNGTEFEVTPVNDTEGNLQKVLTATPGTWTVKFSGKNNSATPSARAGQEFVVTSQVTVLDNQEAVLPEANTEGALRPDQVLTQTGNVDTTAVTAVSATNTTVVPTGASTNVVALVATVLVAASLIFVVKRTRK